VRIAFTPVNAMSPATVAVLPAWARVALTACGTAAARFSDFQDAWAVLMAEGRAWFAHWLTELLIDACLEAPAPSR